VSGSASGTFPSSLSGKASAYQQGSATAGFTVIDGFVTAEAHLPTSELFLFLHSPAKVSEVKLVPVALAQLKDKSFVPSGSFAVFATAYDIAAKDYTRWLLGTSGCLRINSVQAGAIGRVSGVVAMNGEWRSNTDESLGTGSVRASVGAPMLDFRTGVDGITDAMAATVTGVRAKAFSTSTLDAYQVLYPQQTRLLIVGTQPADTTRELWLSIAGVPQPGDSIELGTLTLAEARAGRPAGPGPFGMMRLLELDNLGQPIVREIWRSTAGWVKFSTAVQNGPLALCGMVGGSFSMTTQGTSLAAPTTDLGVTTVTTGTFTTRITILSPFDTLTDAATLPPSPSRMTLRAPVAKSGIACP